MHQMIANPATLAPLEAAPQSGADDVERAVTGAGAAARAWRALPAECRAALLREVAARIRDSARELAELSSQESGLPRCESLDGVRAAAASFEFFGGHAAAEGAQRGGAGESAPGAVAVLAPFALPLPVAGACIGRALAAGCSVIHKPPAQNPLTSLRLARAFDGLPPGTVNVVTGGADVGRALIAHSGIGRVMFTGSAAAGLEIAACARAKVLDLETGTIGAQIVCRSTNLDLAVPAIAWTRLMNGGQGCLSGGHLYVEESVAAEFVDRMHQCVGFLDVDDPAKPSTDLGPLISDNAARKVEDQVGRTLREGARLVLGGRRFRPSGLPGHFFQPTILTEVRPGGLPMREEILGPVITVTRVRDLGQALRLWMEPNHHAPAPSAVSIYTADAEAAVVALQAAARGIFRINDPSIGALGPFSGLHHRAIRLALGCAREAAGGRPAKLVEIAPTVERKPWWFPYIDREHSP